MLKAAGDDIPAAKYNILQRHRLLENGATYYNAKANVLAFLLDRYSDANRRFEDGATLISQLLNSKATVDVQNMAEDAEYSGDSQAAVGTVEIFRNAATTMIKACYEMCQLRPEIRVREAVLHGITATMIYPASANLRPPAVRATEPFGMDAVETVAFSRECAYMKQCRSRCNKRPDAMAMVVARNGGLEEVCIRQLMSHAHMHLGTRRHELLLLPGHSLTHIRTFVRTLDPHPHQRFVRDLAKSRTAVCRLARDVMMYVLAYQASSRGELDNMKKQKATSPDEPLFKFLIAKMRPDVPAPSTAPPPPGVRAGAYLAGTTSVPTSGVAVAKTGFYWADVDNLQVNRICLKLVSYGADPYYTGTNSVCDTTRQLVACCLACI